MMALGSKTPIVILSYRHCELYCCHLDGYKGHSAALLKRLAEIEAIFLSKPPTAKFRLWFNLDENRLDSQALRQICGSIDKYRGCIVKIAFIGLRGYTKHRFRRLFKRAAIKVGYFTDAQCAKDWLI